MSSWPTEAPDSLLPLNADMLFEADLMPITGEDLGAMLDTTTDFDWVCNTYEYILLQHYVAI